MAMTSYISSLLIEIKQVTYRIPARKYKDGTGLAIRLPEVYNGIINGDFLEPHEVTLGFYGKDSIKNNFIKFLDYKNIPWEYGIMNFAIVIPIAYFNFKDNLDEIKQSKVLDQSKLTLDNPLKIGDFIRGDLGLYQIYHVYTPNNDKETIMYNTQLVKTNNGEIINFDDENSPDHYRKKGIKYSQVIKHFTTRKPLKEIKQVTPLEKEVIQLIFDVINNPKGSDLLKSNLITVFNFKDKSYNEIFRKVVEKKLDKPYLEYLKQRINKFYTKNDQNTINESLTKFLGIKNLILQ